MKKTSFAVREDILGYTHQHALRESDVLQRLREETAALPMAIMQIAPEQGQFMTLLVRMTAARRCLEIGTFTGYSALCMAQALPESGELVACDISEEWTAIAQRYWREAGMDARIRLELRPALETLALLAEEGGEPFDMVFIDADKTNYDAYYEAALALLRPGGIILVDNVLWDGQVLDSRSDDVDTLAIQAFNRKLRDDQRVDISMLPIADGLTIACKR